MGEGRQGGGESKSFGGNLVVSIRAALKKTVKNPTSSKYPRPSQLHTSSTTILRSITIQSTTIHPTLNAFFN
jgi:hypothetical protein